MSPEVSDVDGDSIVKIDEPSAGTPTETFPSPDDDDSASGDVPGTSVEVPSQTSLNEGFPNPNCEEEEDSQPEEDSGKATSPRAAALKSNSLEKAENTPLAGSKPEESEQGCDDFLEDVPLSPVPVPPVDVSKVANDNVSELEDVPLSPSPMAPVEPTAEGTGVFSAVIDASATDKETETPYQAQSIADDNVEAASKGGEATDSDATDVAKMCDGDDDDDAVLPIPSLEECLYGCLPENSIHARSDSETNYVLHDDFDFVREPGWWKELDHTIDIEMLRKLATEGIQDEGSHRSVAWRVLLGLLPCQTNKWENTLKEKRELYQSFVKEYFQNASDCFNGEALRWKRKRKKRKGKSGDSAEAPTTMLNSPLKQELGDRGLDMQLLQGVMESMNALQVDLCCSSSDPEIDEADSGTPLQSIRAAASTDDSYNDFIDSAKLLDEIRKDIDRTFPDLKFFLDPQDDLGKRRYGAMERILFVWSKYNKGVKYVQGMNEIVGTLYYVLANDWNTEWSSEAEADTFWMFHHLLTDIRDMFLPDCDEDDTGIHGRIQFLETTLRRHDPQTFQHLSTVGVECSFFALRWWTTLLSREFLLPDTIRLWDSLFAFTRRDVFISFVSVTMVVAIRDTLLNGDFSTCLKTLQKYPTVPMDRLLAASSALLDFEGQVFKVQAEQQGLTVPQAMRVVGQPSGVPMAFGFSRGHAVMTRAEQMETAAESMRVASSKVKQSARGWFGRASRIYNKYNENRLLRRSASQDSHKSGSSGDHDVFAETEIDDVYLSAIQGAETGQYSYSTAV